MDTPRVVYGGRARGAVAMTRRALIALLLGCLVVSGAGCGEECRPTDFNDGRRCSEDGRFVQSCVYNDCFEPPCSEGWFIRESPCPTHLPQCVQISPTDVSCVGEVIGTCSKAGVAGCEDAFTQLTCGDDGTGTLRLMRGPCGPGAQCIPPGSGSYETGCQR